MAINVSGLQWGPGNQFAYDPISKRYFAGENAEGNAWSSGPLSVGSTQYTATPLNNAGYQKWLQANPNNPLGYPGIFQNLSEADFSGVDSLSPELQKYFAPGSLIRSWDGEYGAPVAQTITSAPEESFLSSFMQGPMSVIGPALGISGFMNGGIPGLSNLFGNGGEAALGAGESAVAGSGVWSGGNPIGGGGMWDWLDSIVGNTTDTGDWWSEYGLTSDPTATSAGWSSNPSMSDLTGGVLNNSGGASWWSQLPPDVLKAGGQIAQKLGQTAAESFLRDASARLTGGSGRGILDQFQNDPLGSAFNATPFLLALAQANKQAGDIDGVLSKINGEGYTQAVLHPYDLATGQGRTALEQSLSDRGVAGSSFGYNDLSNFDYMRNLGRGDLANKAQMASAGLEGSLINQRNTNTNLLLGAGLNASGQLFSPKKDPFGLGNLGLASLLG